MTGVPPAVDPPVGVSPDTVGAATYVKLSSGEMADVPTGVREVRETNFCRIYAKGDPHTGKLIVFSAIDNLWKGTSSQAVQNLNLMFGFDEASGLT